MYHSLILINWGYIIFAMEFLKQYGIGKSLLCIEVNVW